MVRPLRIEYEDAFYHVMNRGRNRQLVFPGAAYFEDYLLCLAEAHKRFGIEIHAYCLMGNHYHLLIKTPRGNLSRAMRHIDGIYTQRHNRRKKTDGSIFRGRYKAIVIDAASYLLQVSRYIHQNPIELKKPLVKELENYPWSSYAAYVNKGEIFEWLNRDTVFGELGGARKYSAYKTFVEQGSDNEIARFYQLKNTPSILGDKYFKEFAYRQARSLDGEIDKKGLKYPMPLSQIIEKVASYYGVSVDTVSRAKRGQGTKNVARWIAMKLCQQVGGAKLIDIAKEFHVGHYSTVSQTIGRLNRLIQEDKQVSNDLNVLSQDLTP